MVARAPSSITPEEYLEAERKAETKSEFINGQVVAMSGASLVHGILVNNVSRRIGNQLERRPCQVITNDLRVQIEETGAYVYPDVVIYCGRPRLADRNMDVLLNPTVVFEVLSPSTELVDRTVKFEQYRHLESLTDYVLVTQDRMHVDHFRRHGDMWLYSDMSAPEEQLELESIHCAIPLSEIYDQVFPADEGPATAA